MASQTRTMSPARAPAARMPQGLISQLSTLLVQPGTFFRWMPQGRRWIIVAALVLFVFGFAATRQIATSDSSSTEAETTQSFSPMGFQGMRPSASSSGASASSNADASGETTAQAALAGQTANITDVSLPFATATTTTTETTDTNTSLMSALMAACGILAMWGGQSLLLCLIPLLGGHAPKIGRILQVAVWASLPLALMLALRQIYFMAGGTGGSLGLSLLLDQWGVYDTLPSGAQRLLDAFMSNLTLFSLWSVVLLYCGARYALAGRRWSAALVVLIWMVAAPAVTALVSDPVTAVAPRVTTETATDTATTDDTSTSTTEQAVQMGGMMNGGFPTGSGMPGGGGMPGAGMPGGGGMP